MVRLAGSWGRGLSRSLGARIARGGRSTRFQGIRFRLGFAMALALLPVLVLGAVQAQAEFRRQGADRRDDLQLAASRAAATTRARLDSAFILLEALSPESLGPDCGPRLAALVGRLDGYEALYRVSATGEPICASRPFAPTTTAQIVRSRTWFQRVRAGEATVAVRSIRSNGEEPALVAAVRVERPLGRFDGVMTALLPLESLQPDIADPALPKGAQAALTDAEGNLLVATDPEAFALRGDAPLTGWVERARTSGSGLFEADDARGQHRVYAGAALAGRDVYVLLSAPAPGLLSWARLNPIGRCCCRWEPG